MSGMLLYTSMGLRLRGPTRPYGSYAINFNQSGALPSNISLRNYCCCSLGVPLPRLVSSLLLRFAPHWYPHSDQLQRSRYLINTLASKQAMRVSKVIRKEICEIGRFWARHWKVGVLKACPLWHKCLEIRFFFHSFLLKVRVRGPPVFSSLRNYRQPGKWSLKHLSF